MAKQLGFVSGEFFGVEILDPVTKLARELVEYPDKKSEQVDVAELTDIMIVRRYFAIHCNSQLDPETSAKIGEKLEIKTHETFIEDIHQARHLAQLAIDTARNSLYSQSVAA